MTNHPLLDSFLNAVIDNLDTQTFTVIYTTSPTPKSTPKPASQKDQSRHPSYEMGDPLSVAMHTDLKRDLDDNIKARQNGTLNNAPLFETYNFLSPGKPLRTPCDKRVCHLFRAAAPFAIQIRLFVKAYVC